MPDSRTSIHLQVSSLLLEDDGRLTPRIQAGRTLRAAILADLVAAGALRNGAESIEIVPVADLLPLPNRMLQDMRLRPDENLIWWAHHDHISVDDAAEEMVGLGLWQRHAADLGLAHRYSWRDESGALAGALRAAVGGSYAESDRSQIAAHLALVGGLWGGVPRRPDPDVVERLGRVNWLVPDLIDYLWSSAIQLRVAALDTL